MLSGRCWQRRGAAHSQLTCERDTEGLVAERCSFCALTQGCRDCTRWRQGLRQACLRQRPGDSETRAKSGAHRRTRGCCAMCSKCALPERPQRGAMYWGFGAVPWGGGALGRASHRGTAKPSHARGTLETAGYDLAGAKNPTSNAILCSRHEKQWRGMSERFGRHAGADFGAANGRVVLFLALLACCSIAAGVHGQSCTENTDFSENSL